MRRMLRRLLRRPEKRRLHRPCHHCECPELHSVEELRGTQFDGRSEEEVQVSTHPPLLAPEECDVFTRAMVRDFEKSLSFRQRLFCPNCGHLLGGEFVADKRGLCPHCTADLRAWVMDRSREE